MRMKHTLGAYLIVSIYMLIKGILESNMVRILVIYQNSVADALPFHPSWTAVLSDMSPYSLLESQQKASIWMMLSVKWKDRMG